MVLPPLFIARHGQTEWNRLGRMQGHLDSALTKQGEAEAKALRRFLETIIAQHENVKAFASPQGRVRQTWQIALAGIDLVPQEDERLREVMAGDWQGLTDAQIEAISPHIYNAHQTRIGLSFHAPNGESFEQIEARCRSFLEALRAPSLIFTHGVTMAVLRGLALGVDYQGVTRLDHRQGVVYVLQDGEEQVLSGG